MDRTLDPGADQNETKLHPPHNSTTPCQIRPFKTYMISSSQELYYSPTIQPYTILAGYPRMPAQPSSLILPRCVMGLQPAAASQRLGIQKYVLWSSWDLAIPSVRIPYVAGSPALAPGKPFEDTTTAPHTLCLTPTRADSRRMTIQWFHGSASLVN